MEDDWNCIVLEGGAVSNFCLINLILQYLAMVDIGISVNILNLGGIKFFCLFI